MYCSNGYQNPFLSTIVEGKAEENSMSGEIQVTPSQPYSLEDCISKSINPFTDGASLQEKIVCLLKNSFSSDSQIDSINIEFELPEPAEINSTYIKIRVTNFQTPLYLSLISAWKIIKIASAALCADASIDRRTLNLSSTQIEGEGSEVVRAFKDLKELWGEKTIDTFHSAYLSKNLILFESGSNTDLYQKLPNNTYMLVIVHTSKDQTFNQEIVGCTDKEIQTKILFRKKPFEFNCSGTIYLVGTISTENLEPEFFNIFGNLKEEITKTPLRNFAKLSEQDLYATIGALIPYTIDAIGNSKKEKRQFKAFGRPGAHSSLVELPRIWQIDSPSPSTSHRTLLRISIDGSTHTQKRARTVSSGESGSFQLGAEFAQYILNPEKITAETLSNAIVPPTSRYLTKCLLTGEIELLHPCGVQKGWSSAKNYHRLLLGTIMCIPKNPGVTLGEFTRQKKWDYNVILQIMSQLSNNLSLIQQRGFVHRDIKPDNIIIHEPIMYTVEKGDTWDKIHAKLKSKNAPFVPLKKLMSMNYNSPLRAGLSVMLKAPDVQIIDFGVSLFSSGENTSKDELWDTTTVGTPKYMSPNKFCSNNGDSKLIQYEPDTYSLCIVFYELLTGHQFHEPNLQSIIKKNNALNLSGFEISKKDQKLPDYIKMFLLKSFQNPRNHPILMQELVKNYRRDIKTQNSSRKLDIKINRPKVSIEQFASRTLGATIGKVAITSLVFFTLRQGFRNRQYHIPRWQRDHFV